MLLLIISILLLVLSLAIGIKYYMLREENMSLEASVEAHQYLSIDNKELRNENLRLTKLNDEYKKLIDDHSISIKKAITDDGQKTKIDNGGLYLHNDELLVKGVKALEGKGIE